MGIDPAIARALALHASNSGSFPVEFSLAAFSSFGPCNMCGGNVAIFQRVTKAGVSDPGYSGACFGDFDRHCNFALSYRREVRISASLDFYRACRVLVTLGILITRF